MFAASKTAAGASAPVSSTDPNFRNVALLLNDTGTNGQQNNTFLDSSSNNFTITRNGTPTQGSMTPYWPDGQWSNFFNGTSDFLTGSANSAYLFGTSSFTVEAWVYLTGNAALDNSNERFASIFAVADGGGSFNTGLEFNISGNSTTTGTGLRIYKNLNTAEGIGVSATIAQNTWHHVAVSKDGSNIRFYLNGTQIGSTLTSTTIWGSSTINARVGRLWDSNYVHAFPGYISNLRVVKGTALYTSNFTPSTTPLTAVSGTSLLTCQSNRFRDNSSNNFAITVNGSPQVTAFDPFSPAASYSTSLYGGSGFFSGSSQFLTISNNPTQLNLGTNNFTIECWMRPTSITFEMNIIATGGAWGTGATRFGKNGNFGMALYTRTASDVVIVSEGNNNAINTLANQWTHYAITRSGNNFVLYRNGVSVGTGTYTGSVSFVLNNSSVICSDWNNGFFPGNLTDLRIVNGSVVYTGNFTPPTAPLTAISGTALLLNFTNAGIFDAATLNNLITSGSTQASTGQAKWGSSSIYFTSSATDFITAPNSPDVTLGSADFTFEGWFYKTGNPASATQFIWWNGNSNNNSQAALRVQLDNGGTISLLCSQSGTAWQINTSSTATYSNNTWNHIAAVRNGQTVTVYLNGVSVCSGSLTSSTASLFAGTLNYINQMAFGSGVWKMVGYVEDIRLTKGIARYTANFTPPTAPFPTR